MSVKLNNFFDKRVHNGFPVQCAVASGIDTAGFSQDHLKGHTIRLELMSRIEEAAQNILQEAGSDYVLRLLAIEEPTVRGARINTTEGAKREAVDCTYEKTGFDTDATWAGSKRVYTYR